MAVLDNEKHEAYLSELLNPELSQDRRSEILVELRADRQASNQESERISSLNETLKKKNEDLLIANGNLFSKLGFQHKSEEQKKEEEKKEKSETITLENLLGGK